LGKYFKDKQKNLDNLKVYENGVKCIEELIKSEDYYKINWVLLSLNPQAMHILNNPKCYMYIYWRHIINNPEACELLQNNLDKVERYWYDISKKPYLIDIIEKNIDKIDWIGLSENYNAIHILEKNIDKVNINKLRYNKNGFTLLLSMGEIFDDEHEYTSQIVYDYFDYCEKNNITFNLTKLLSEYGYTHNHLEFLQNNHGHINYQYLSLNPNIFEYDYKNMCITRQSMSWYNDIKK